MDLLIGSRCFRIWFRILSGSDNGRLVEKFNILFLPPTSCFPIALVLPFSVSGYSHHRLLTFLFLVASFAHPWPQPLCLPSVFAFLGHLGLICLRPQRYGFLSLLSLSPWVLFSKGRSFLVFLVTGLFKIWFSSIVRPQEELFLTLMFFYVLCGFGNLN